MRTVLGTRNLCKWVTETEDSYRTPIENKMGAELMKCLSTDMKFEGNGVCRGEFTYSSLRTLP